MRRLAALILALCPIFAGFVGMSVLIGRQQPLPDHLAMLHLSECAPPCWIGIMPGVTTLEAALPLIKAHYVNLPDYQTILSGNLTTATIQVSNLENPGDKFSINVYADNDGTINTIGFDTYGSTSSPSIGELSNLFGPPTGIASIPSSLYNGIISYSLAFDAHDCIAATTIPYPDNRADIFQHPSTFYFGNGDGCSAQNRQPAWKAWRGFQALDAYSH